MEQTDTGYALGARRILQSVRRFTVVRDAITLLPMEKLKQMMEYLIDNEPYRAADAYHELTHALMTGGYWRLSGNLWTDFLLYVFVVQENEFSRLAAAGIWDEALAAGMRADLSLSEPLFGLSSSKVKTMLTDAYKDALTRPKGQKDKIAALSSVVWSGGSTRPLPADSGIKLNVTPQKQFAMDINAFISWRYQPEFAFHECAAGLSLEELARRLVNIPDRERLLDDLYHFHTEYGTGLFIKDRLFVLQPDGQLQAMPVPEEPEVFPLYQAEREAAMKNAIRFMRGEAYSHMLLTGGPLTGKTVQVFSLMRELPEMRMLCVPRGTLCEMIKILPRLLGQPFKLMLFLEDFDAADPSFLQLRTYLSPGGVQRKNIFLCAAARTGSEDFFELKIHFNTPPLKEFMELVQWILLQKGIDMDFDIIRNACVDYAAAAGKNGEPPLSYRAAESVAGDLLGTI